MPSALWLILSLTLLGFAGCERDSTTQQKNSDSGPSNPSTASQDTAAKVLKIISDQLGVRVGELKPSVHLVKDLKVDDLDTVELVMEVEDTFEISISDADADRLKTVGDWIRFVQSRVQR